MVKLTIVLLLVAATCFGQHPLDTIRVQRLVVDTSSNLLAPFPRPARLVSLLEVRELHNEAENVNDPFSCANCLYKLYYKHIRYLTVLRAPIPFGWVVFEGTILQETDPADKVEPHEWDIKVDTMGHIRPMDTLYHMFLSGDFIKMTLFNSDSSVWITHSLTGSTGWAPLPPRWLGGTLTATTIQTGPAFLDWLPRRLRKRYLKYLKTHPHAQ